MRILVSCHGGVRRALLRGRYMGAVARMEWAGVPLDATTLARLRVLMKEPQWITNAEAEAFLREAAELIEGRPAPPKP